MKTLLELKSFCPQQIEAAKSAYFETYDVVINISKLK